MSVGRGLEALGRQELVAHNTLPGSSQAGGLEGPHKGGREERHTAKNEGTLPASNRSAQGCSACSLLFSGLPCMLMRRLGTAPAPLPAAEDALTLYSSWLSSCCQIDSRSLPPALLAALGMPPAAPA